jgi:DNA-binding protein HU-beta
MGFLKKLFGRTTPEAAPVKAKPAKVKVAKPVTPAKKTAPKPAAKKGPAKAAAKAPAKKAPAKAAKKEHRPQCSAVTKAGDQCKSSAREGSKNCGSHKGYKPTAKAVVAKAKDTKPAAKKAADTKPTARKAPAKAVAKTPAKKAPATKAPAKKTPAKKAASKSAQVRHEDYRLYKAGNRYYFSKKAPGELAGSAQAVKEIPADREIVVTSTGLPVLKKK